MVSFWLWEVKYMDKAVELVTCCSHPMSGPGQIEMRLIFRASGFDGALNPEADGAGTAAQGKVAYG